MKWRVTLCMKNGRRVGFEDVVDLGVCELVMHHSADGMSDRLYATRPGSPETIAVLTDPRLAMRDDGCIWVTGGDAAGYAQEWGLMPVAEPEPVEVPHG